MVEIKTGATFKIGISRAKYLDLASEQYGLQSPQGFKSALGHIDAFEATLDAGSESKKEWLRRKETIENDRKEAVRKWEQWKETLNYFEQFDVQPQRDVIEINSIKERLEAAWDIAKRYALFNE